MKLWPNPHKHGQEHSGAGRVCLWIGRLAALICGFLGSILGPLAPHEQGYQDESLTVAITGADGGALPDVNVDLRRAGKLLAGGKADAKAGPSVRVRKG